MPNPNSVDKSPHKQAIIDLLNEGWSAQRVLDYLKHRYDPNDLPSISAVKRYREAHIDPVAVLPARLVTDAMRKLKGAIDEIREIDVLYRAQRERVAMFWQRETENGSAEPQANEAVRIAMELLSRRFQLAAQLGIGRAGKDKRISLTESRALELPEETFHEFIELLRTERNGGRS